VNAKGGRHDVADYSTGERRSLIAESIADNESNETQLRLAMNPTDVGQSYDSIAHRWQVLEQPLNGLVQHERALRFAKPTGYALDVGCGCNGRFLDLLKMHGFTVEGLDVSEQMVSLARQRDPEVQFHHADICQWVLPRKYDFITGWDSIWHVPLEAQAGVLQKLFDGLAAGGVLIFTLGGRDQPGEVRDAHMGPPMYTATLGIPRTLELLTQCGCVCRHLEYDQCPESHVYIIAQKTELTI
jgi:2-polyprenyl-3-methyl-5-hydroxy-6-metoxy-1,4-benzoquinol methylase